VSQCFPPSPVSTTARLLNAVAKSTPWTCTATTPQHAQLTQVPPRRTTGWCPHWGRCSARPDTRTQRGVTASAGQRRGDVEIRSYRPPHGAPPRPTRAREAPRSSPLFAPRPRRTWVSRPTDQAGSRSLVFDLSIAHDRFVSSSHVQQNGLLTHPQDLDGPLRVAAQRKINAYRQSAGSNTLTIRTFLFSPLESPPAAACTASFCVIFFYRPTWSPSARSF